MLVGRKITHGIMFAVEFGEHQHPSMPYKNILNRSLIPLLLLSACAGLPVRGRAGMQTIEARVDSEVARYYLGSYLAEERNDAALDERIDRVYQKANGPESIYPWEFPPNQTES